MNQGDHDSILGGGYLFRALSPSQTTAIALARGFGVSPSALAAEYGVSIRTIYRASRYAAQRRETVTVGDWEAEFIVGDEGPIRVTSWHAKGRS